MTFQHYPDVHRYFVNLYLLNQDWLEKRSKIKEKDLKKLFDLFLDISENLEKIKDVLEGE